MTINFPSTNLQVGDTISLDGITWVWDGVKWSHAAGAGGGGGGGGVKSVTAGAGLTGGTITDTGTIALQIPVSVGYGGTSANTAVTARTNLGIGTIATANSPLPLANGGTAATSAADARVQLGVDKVTLSFIISGKPSAGQVLNWIGLSESITPYLTLVQWTVICGTYPNQNALFTLNKSYGWSTTGTVPGYTLLSNQIVPQNVNQMAPQALSGTIGYREGLQLVCPATQDPNMVNVCATITMTRL